MDNTWMRLGNNDRKREGYENGERKHEGTGSLRPKGYRKIVNMETLDQDYISHTAQCSDALIEITEQDDAQRQAGCTPWNYLCIV